MSKVKYNSIGNLKKIDDRNNDACTNNNLKSEIRGLRSDCGYGRYVWVLLLVLIILSECHFLVKYINIRFLYGSKKNSICC